MADVTITVYDHCKGCGICIDVCPKNVLEPSERVNEYGLPSPIAARPEDCIKCRLCELNCPDFAIDVEVNE